MNEPIILALIPYVVPSVIGMLVYFYHQLFARLPQKQQAALEQLATPIVEMVEQKYINATPAEKKAAALHAIELGFAALNIPEPDSALIDAFIESAVFEMNRLKAAPPITQPLPQISRTSQLKKGN